MNSLSHIDCHHHWNSIQRGIMGRYKNFMPIPDKPFKFVSGTWEKGTQLFDMTTGKFIDGGIVDGEEGLFRGNAPLLKTDFGYMGITHKLDFDERKRKRYNNFLVEYNSDLSIRRISKPFKLCASNIEFVTTFLELPNDELFIGVTEMDEHPLGMIFDRKELVSKLYDGNNTR